jgi:hypothetical protein
MNPNTNEFEPLKKADLHDLRKQLQDQIAAMSCDQKPPEQFLREDGSPVPEEWAVFTQDEIVSIKGYDFRVHAILKRRLILTPVGPSE